MARSLSEIREDIRLLSADEKEALLHSLITDLEQPMSEEIEQAWMVEVNRRLEQFRDGTAEPVPADRVFTELRTRLAK